MATLFSKLNIASPWLILTVAFLEFRPVRNVRENFAGTAVMAVRHTLTWNRGEHFRVVGILGDG